MKRTLLLLLVLLMLPLCALGEDTDDADDWDWRADWEEYGYFEFCDVQDDTLIIFEGVTALGEARTSYWDDELEKDIEIEPKFENGPSWWIYDEGGDFHKVSLPSTLRYLGMESFSGYDFDDFTLPAQLEVLENWAFYACDFDVLRIETTLPIGDILDSMDNCTVRAYEAPEDHPLYKTIDGVLFTKDGKTLLAYPDRRTDTHYDVPAGVERIEGIHNEYLQTVSLPIGLQSIGDYGFSGCVRLQSIALPLTVKEIGKEIFSACVSLELVSLPEGLEAEKDERGYWEEYYPDDALFRGDNGDTLGGERSSGWIGVPGRVRNAEKWYATLYETADGKYAGKVLSGKRIVDMERYRNGRVEVKEPLTNQTLGWVNLEDLEYLPQETLFSYADVQPKETMEVWWNHLPYDSGWDPWETKIPLEGKRYDASFYGPFVRFIQQGTYARFACRIEDAALTRKPDGTGNVYGVLYQPRRQGGGVSLLDSPGGKAIKTLAFGTKVSVTRSEGDWYLVSDGQDEGWVEKAYMQNSYVNDISLWSEPDGEKMKSLIGGTQIQILDEKDGWVQVTDGRDTGWVEEKYVLIVPEQQEGEEQ